MNCKDKDDCNISADEKGMEMHVKWFGKFQPKICNRTAVLGEACPVLFESKNCSFS